MLFPMTFLQRAHYVCHFSLSSITCPGSLGIISARYLEHPFLRRGKDRKSIKTEVLSIKIFSRYLKFCLNSTVLILNSTVLILQFQYYNSGFLLFCLTVAITDLFFNRFSITDLGILVGFLFLGTTNDFVIKSRNRLMTISLFLSWLRSSSQLIIKTFSRVNLDFNLA